MDQDTPKLRRPTWDASTAAAAIALGALAYLWLVRRGFRSVLVSVGS